MKEIVKTSRLAGQLEKLFRMLNTDLFGGRLKEPVITIQSSSKSYGHYTVSPVWTVNGQELKHEINISAGMLDRPIENVICTLVHEMVHYFDDTVLNIQDCSRGGSWHNRKFKETAESVGLIVKSDKSYGWAHTEPGDGLLEWIIDHLDSINEIKLNRNEPSGIRITGGNNTGNASGGQTSGKNGNSHSIKYVCPCCGQIARTTKISNLICGDCMETLVIA